jgi:hypothetical protein
MLIARATAATAAATLDGSRPQGGSAMSHHVPALGLDPYDPSLRSAFDHAAFYDHGEPFRGDVEDTGLRCYCGREVVASDESRTGWSHVGVGDRLTAIGGAVR